MLDSLIIKNFRSLADFEVAKLGRVNLIVGKNNSGKSSVLEALRIYAASGQRELLDSISAEHDERYRLRETERTEPDAPMPFQDFFTGRSFPAGDDTAIQIGSAQKPDEVLRVQHILLAEEREPVVDEVGETSFRVRRRIVPKQQLQTETGELRQAIQITKGERRYPPFFLDSGYSRPRPPTFEAANFIPCSVIPTQFISPDELADEWDKIALVESTLAGKGLERHIQAAQAQGYEVIMVFVTLDSPELCIARIRERVAQGGHFVPDDDVRRRFYRARKLFWLHYRHLADNWQLFSNTGEGFDLLAAGSGEAVVEAAPDELAAFVSSLETA